MKLRGLDLFSGIGGLSLGLKPWVRSTTYCESDAYAQGVLLSRMRSGDIESAPIWDDVRTLHCEPGQYDIVFGGFPCQDLSAAGLGKGLAGERSGLYFEIERIVREAAPTFVFLENVPAIRTRGLGRVVWGLSELGYDLRWTVVSAAETGAPHLRKRWFCLAYRHGRGFKIYEKRHREESKGQRKQRNDADRLRDSLADTNGERGREGRTGSQIRERGHGTVSGSSPVANSESARRSIERDTGSTTARQSNVGNAGWFARHDWTSEPDVGRVANGISYRVDRLRCLGNAVVPEQAKTAFTRLIGLE